MVVHIFYKDNKGLWRKFSLVLIAVLAALCARGYVLPARADGIVPSGMDTAIQKMKNGFYNFESEIDLTGCGVTPDSIGEIFIFVIKNDPYLFFVDTKLSYTYKSDGSMFKISPRYTVTPSAAAEMIAFCTGEVERIAAFADPRLSDAENALIIHDLLCAEYEYDPTYINDDMYKFLYAKNGTCQGYAWTYMAVLRSLGIECCYVASDTINHIWNMVKIDEYWYHCDLTWDDSTDGYADRRHFLCSDTKAKRSGHRDWYSAYGLKCSSDKYDDFDFEKLTHDVGSGDADHSRRVELYDLLRVRAYARDIYNVEICAVCADVNKDMMCDDTDAELIRQKILGAS